MRRALECVGWDLDNWRVQSHGRDYHHLSVFAGTKKVASYMWQSSKRGALVVLVLAVSPTLLPLALFVSFVAAVPLLCGAAAYYLLFALQVRGSAHLLLSARWNSQYEQRNDEPGNWRPLNGTSDVFIAAALRSEVTGIVKSSNEIISKSSCREAPAGQLVAFEKEAELVEANPTFAKPSPTVTIVELNYPVQGQAHAELPLGKSLPSGEVYSVAIEGEPAGPVSGLLEEGSFSCATCNEFPPDVKKLSVSTSAFSDYTWPSDSSEHEGFELGPSTRGPEYEDDTASSTAQYEEESDLERSSAVTLSLTPDDVTEDWVTRRKRWEEESTPAPSSPNMSVESRSMFNPLFEFESTPSLPALRKLNSGDKKNHICNSPSSRTRLSKRHSAPRELHQTLSTSGSTLSPRQITVQRSKSGLNALENEQGTASCEACAQSREGEPTSRAGANIRSSLRLPWR